MWQGRSGSTYRLRRGMRTIVQKNRSVQAVPFFPVCPRFIVPGLSIHLAEGLLNCLVGGNDPVPHPELDSLITARNIVGYDDYVIRLKANLLAPEAPLVILGTVAE